MRARFYNKKKVYEKPNLLEKMCFNMHTLFGFVLDKYKKLVCKMLVNQAAVTNGPFNSSNKKTYQLILHNRQTTSHFITI